MTHLHDQPAAVVTVGAPVIDYMLQVDEDFISRLRRGRWGMQEIDQARFDELLAAASASPVLTPGGSAANTAQGLARLGHPCSHVGAIGRDANGDLFREHLTKYGISSRFIECRRPTRKVLCMVTPDGRRTFRAVPGADAELSPDLLRREHFEGARLVHIEGYSLLHNGVMERSMELAKEVGAEVSIDLATHEIARQHWHRILNLVEGYTDILFCNREEITALGAKSPSDGCRLLSEMCKIAVVLMGKRGCLVGSQGEIYAFPTESVEPVDTTGAGDHFASGFLHGYLSGQSNRESARYGSILGRSVVQYLGAQVPESAWTHIREELRSTSLVS